MKRIKKKIFLWFCAACLIMLGTLRHCNPDITSKRLTPKASQDSLCPDSQDSKHKILRDRIQYTKIRGVHSYDIVFPDLQDVQIRSAMQWGVAPVANRREAERRKDELVYIGAYPFYVIDSKMKLSIPYLVPRAASLLQTIGRNYLDSLAAKGIPLHKIIVTSVLRTEEDVAKLRINNLNASEQSCHRFGTTFDICYTRFETVCPPGEMRRSVRNDTLKYVLSEVLRDLRDQGRCWIKHEKKQPCFHITIR